MNTELNDNKYWEELERQDKGCLTYKDYETYDSETREMLDMYTNHIPSVNLDMTTGDVIEGEIVSISTKEIALDLKVKDYVYIDVKASEKELLSKYRIGDTIKAVVVNSDRKTSEIKASISAFVKINAYRELDEAYENRQHVLALVKERIPAGFTLDILKDGVSISAFMPNTLSGSNRLTEKQSQDLVGKELNVMIESIEKEKGVYVVSRKKYLKSIVPQELEIIKNNPVETLYSGIVTGTTNFAVFVEFNGCITGMIHAKNLEGEYKNNISSIEAGMVIDFYVREILETGKGTRINLSQNLNESLWDTIEEGQVLKSKVISIKTFGVLVELSDDAMGLVYKTNLEKYKGDIKEGEELDVKVITTDKLNRKIYLDIA